MYLVYNLSIIFLTILISPLLLFQVITKKKYRMGLKQRLGFLPEGVKKLQEKRPIWLHAVSVGEVNASLPLVREIKEKYPDIDMVISTITATGNITARDKVKETEHIIFFPFDYPWIVTRVVEDINPRLFITMETEIWPNFLKTLRSRKIPSLILNGRISNRSFGKYRAVSFFMKRVLSCLSFIGMQTEKDAKRIAAMGAKAEKVQVMGNIKFDAPVPASEKDENRLKSSLGLLDHEEIMIAGSTHAGEEEKVLEMYRRIKKEHPSFILIIAPRHIERVREIEELIQRGGFIPVRKTSLEKGLENSFRENNSVLILDTLGELSGLYQISSLIFVGGSLMPDIGGHNILEPAVWKKPVFFGPHMDNFTEIALTMKREGGGIQIKNESEFVEKANELLKDRKKYEELGIKAYQTIQKNQGALLKSLEAVNKFI